MIGQYLSRVLSGAFRGIRLLVVILIALIALCFVVFCTILLALPLAGRGDWSIPINEHYKIVRSNGSEITLNYYIEPSDPISECLTEKFYIIEFYADYQTIYLSGIPTSDKYATEAERESTDYCYCIVDMTTQGVTGPISGKEWAELCTQSGIDMTGKWIPATYETAEAMKETAVTQA